MSCRWELALPKFTIQGKRIKLQNFICQKAMLLGSAGSGFNHEISNTWSQFSSMWNMFYVFQPINERFWKQTYRGGSLKVLEHFIFCPTWYLTSLGLVSHSIPMKRTCLSVCITVSAIIYFKNVRQSRVCEFLRLQVAASKQRMPTLSRSSAMPGNGKSQELWLHKDVHKDRLPCRPAQWRSADALRFSLFSVGVWEHQ